MDDRESQTISPGDVGRVEDFLTDETQNIEQTQPEQPQQEAAPEPEHSNGEFAEPEAESANITDINQLDLQTEPLPDVDENKLADRMEYAPSLQPGKFFNFIFKLDEAKPVEGVTIKGKLQTQFNYECMQVRDDGSAGKTIRFCQANTFRTGKMESSRAEELLFALGLLGRFQREKQAHAQREKSFMLELLREASEAQKVIRGQINWRRYDKETKQTWSTNPAKPYTKNDGTKVTELSWPKDASGKFNPRPDEFNGNYGNEQISRVAPTKETLETSKQEATQG